MSDAVTLTLRGAIGRRLEAESIVPDAFAALDQTGIARLPLWDGPCVVPLGDVFQVRGGRSSTVRLAGDLALVDAIGAGVAAHDDLAAGHAARRGQAARA